VNQLTDYGSRHSGLVLLCTNGEPARVDTLMTHRKLSFVESGHDINMDRYGEWTVIKLKNELRSRGAVTTGRKTDLIER